ncbi:MAG TPA: hypothetical protein VLL76_07770, partial [Candidatus Omnitrophota bacterium]|nr:hypothetical protein [Candidatus Omnitrophota bacterium]
GEPIWCCGSMTVAKGWTDAEEAAYVAAAEAEDLADAASEKWSNVYRTFVPLSATSPFGTPLPRCTDSGTLAYDGWLYPVGKTLTRQTPLRQDVDYSENLPGTARAGVPRDLRPPAVYAIPNAPDEETGTIGYVPIDRFSAIEEWGLGGCHVSVLDDRVGIRLAGAFAHAAAGEWEADTWSEPETDWTTLQVCAAVRCDDRLRIVEAVAGTAGQLPRRVVIDVPGAELWVVLAGTPLDTADGNIVSAAENTVIRDDTDRLKPVAALAKAWYGRQRNACRIAYRQIATALAPGDILTTVTVGGGSADVNCPISGVTWDFAACRTEIETDFAELDFAAIAAVHHPHGAYSAVDGWNDSGRADAAMPNSPVRLAAAGGVKPQRPTRLGKYIASPAFVDGDETVWLAPCDDDGTVTDEPAVEVYLIAPPAGQTRTPRLTFTGSGTYPYFLTEEGRAVLGNAEMPPHLVLVEGGTDVNGIDPVADGQGWISKRDDDTLEHRDPRPEDNIIFRSCSVTGWAFDQRGHLTGWWENQYIEGEWQEVWTSPWGYDEPEELVLDEFTVTGAAEGAQCTTSPTWTGGGNPTNRRLVVEWGDGSSNTYEEAVSGAARTHTYTHCTEAVSHDYPVTIRTGGKHKHATCTVTNIAPTDVSGTLADNTIGVGEEAVMTVTWANAYATDTHTVHINWGDGITTDTPNATSPCVVRHTYVAPYTGAVLVSVEDDDGAVVSDATQPTITVTGPPIEVDAGIDEIIDVDESILHEITWTGGYGAFQVRAWADGIDPEDGFVENGVSSPYNLAIGPSPAPMGPVTIHVRITDSSGTQDEDTFTLTVVEP